MGLILLQGFLIEVWPFLSHDWSVGSIPVWEPSFRDRYHPRLLPSHVLPAATQLNVEGRARLCRPRRRMGFQRIHCRAPTLLLALSPSALSLAFSAALARICRLRSTCGRIPKMRSCVFGPFSLVALILTTTSLDRHSNSPSTFSHLYASISWPIRHYPQWNHLWISCNW